MKPTLVALMLIAGTLPASAQVIDRGLKPGCKHIQGYGWDCTIRKEFGPKPLKGERAPDWRTPPVRCFSPRDPGCGGGWG